MNLYFFTQFDSPVGTIIAIADNQAIIGLQFVSEGMINQVLLEYQKVFKGEFQKKVNSVLMSLEKELTAYFKGELYQFATPYRLSLNSTFQKEALLSVSSVAYGTTQSYKDIALKLNKPSAMRAVGNANAKNPLMLLIPCHRIIKLDKKIGGYAGGVHVKQWLLDHERQVLQKL